MTGQTKISPLQKTLLLLFFFSGIAGLAYQIIWVKLLSQIFGHTIFAVSTVVATFMAGLALGSYVIGKKADRVSSPLRLYAALELGIGLYALALNLLFPSLDALYAQVFTTLGLGFSTFSTGRFLLTFLILIVPTFLIGGTFPAIARHYIRHIEGVRNDSAVLYAVNTVGAVSGALLTGFFFLQWLGISTTTYLMVGVNLLLSGTAYLLSTRYELKKEETVPKEIDNKYSYILFIYAVAGFVSLALEVLWTRELSIVFLSSTYSFSTVLVTYLSGLTIGSFLMAGRKISITKAITYFYRVEYGVAIMALVSIPLLKYLPQKLYIQAVAEQTITWPLELMFNFIIAFLVLIIPTLLMGAAFPLVCAIYSRSLSHVGNDLGRVYAFNTVGSIFGSLITGFILIPVLGIVLSLQLISAIAFFVVAAIVIKYTSFTKNIYEHLFLVIVFSVLFFAISTRDGEFRPLPEGTTVLFAKEGISAEVKVLKDESGEISLYINEKQQGGTRVEQTERWTGQVPMIIHGKADSVLLIGLGTGVTLNALTEGPVGHVTCVDLIGSLKSAVDYFGSINDNVLRKTDQVTFVEADGINYLKLVPASYDLILCDIVHPDDVGAGDLYSLEFYENCRTRLKEDGLFSQWMLLEQLAPEDLNIIMATFKKVFPGMQIYLGQDRGQSQKLMLAGSKNGNMIRLEEITKNLQQMSFTDEFTGKTDSYSFLSYFVTDGKSLQNLLASVKINSRDHPIIEYQSPKNKWLNAKSIRNLSYLNTLRKPIVNFLPGIDTADSTLFTTYFNARTHLINGRLQENTFEYKAADISYSEAALLDVDTLLTSDLLANNAWNLVRESNFELAITAFKKSLAVNHLNVRASFSLAELLLNQGRKAEAKEFYLYTVHYDPNHADAFRRLGDIYSGRKEFDNAFYAYRMSLEADDNQPVIHYILGQIYFNYKKDYPNAVRRFQKSLELNPSHHYNREAREMLRKIEAMLTKQG